MKNKILLIIAYFGKFHNYFDLFLKSCEWNPDVNWLIVTDNKAEYDYPENVQKVENTFEQLKEKIQSLYDFPVVLEKPYDLCDLKVAYGEVFQNYIKGYDFWGYCDCDVIFGKISDFLTDQLLEKYDKLLMRGHFTLYRNTADINRMYRNPIDGVEQYKIVFSEPGAHHFDEGLPELVPGINRIFIDAGQEIYDEYILLI